MQDSNREILESKLKKLALFLFFLVVFFSFVYPVRDPDTPWHLKTGEYIFMNRTIPMSSDPFSFAKEKIPFTGRFILSQNWVAEVLFFLIYRTAGPLGLVLTRAAVFTSIIAIVYYLVDRKKGYFVAMLSAGAVAFFTHRFFSGIRPQIFTFLFSAVVILLIEKYRDTGSVKWLFPLPLLMVLWANMHGGFIYGVVLIFIYLLGDGIELAFKNVYASKEERRRSVGQLKSLLAFGLLSVLFSLMNPDTYKAFIYTFMTQSPGYNIHSLYLNIMEYRSPYSLIRENPTLAYGFLGCAACALVLATILIRRRRLTHLLLLIFAITPAIIASRYIPLFLIVTAPMFAYLPKSDIVKPPAVVRVGTQFVLISFFSFIAIYSNPFRNRDILSFHESFIYPVRATNFLLKNGIKGNIFASYNTAAFTLFRCYPKSRIYFDSRFVDVRRVYTGLTIEGAYDTPREILTSINRLVPAGIGTISISGDTKGVHRTKKSWKEMLDSINADIIVHEAVNHFSGQIYPLIFNLAGDNTWKLIYADGTVMIFVKNEPKFRKIIARYQLPKSRIYDEILEECRRGAGLDGADHYSSIGLALLLKGIANKDTAFYIDRALSLSPNNAIAEYSKALLFLMTHRKKPHPERFTSRRSPPLTEPTGISSPHR